MRSRRSHSSGSFSGLFSSNLSTKPKFLCMLLSLISITLMIIWKNLALIPERDVFFAKEQSCVDIATNSTEPYTEEYEFKHTGVDISEEMWADYHWEGSITKEMVDKMADRDPMDYDRFKIIDNKLYVWQTSRLRETVHKTDRNKMLWNMLWMALAWFKVPDVEFLVDYDDSQHHGGGPALYIAFRRELGNLTGFTIPGMPAILYALGPQQMSVHHDCLRARYPPGRARIPKAVWRGKWWRTQSTGVPRVKLVEAAAGDKAIADIKFTSYEACVSVSCTAYVVEDEQFQDNRTVAMAMEEFPPGDPIPQEEFNKYAFIVDIDGIGWSGRFAELLAGITPVLKQETSYPEHFWSHVVKDNVVTLFATDASDFSPKLSAAIREWKKDPEGYQILYMERMKKFARTHLTHFGIARAAAYSLTVYGGKMTWKPVMEPGYVKATVDFGLLPGLPEPFLVRLRELVD